MAYSEKELVKILEEFSKGDAKILDLSGDHPVYLRVNGMGSQVDESSEGEGAGPMRHFRTCLDIPRIVRGMPLALVPNTSYFHIRKITGGKYGARGFVPLLAEAESKEPYKIDLFNLKGDIKKDKIRPYTSIRVTSEEFGSLENTMFNLLTKNGFKVVKTNMHYDPTAELEQVHIRIERKNKLSQVEVSLGTEKKTLEKYAPLKSYFEKLAGKCQKA